MQNQHSFLVMKRPMIIDWKCDIFRHVQTFREVRGALNGVKNVHPVSGKSEWWGLTRGCRDEDKQAWGI